MPTPPPCPADEYWRGLFADPLLPDEEERCERHLKSCPTCQDRLDRDEDCRDELLSLARQVGDPTLVPADPTLVQVLERLHEGKGPAPTTAGDPADLYFLRPDGRPGLLGTLGG
jgi:hypothetical protein